jgi:hypothetical protein
MRSCGGKALERLPFLISSLVLVLARPRTRFLTVAVKGSLHWKKPVNEGPPDCICPALGEARAHNHSRPDSRGSPGIAFLRRAAFVDGECRA